MYLGVKNKGMQLNINDILSAIRKKIQIVAPNARGVLFGSRARENATFVFGKYLLIFGLEVTSFISVSSCSQMIRLTVFSTISSFKILNFLPIRKLIQRLVSIITLIILFPGI